MKFTVHVDAGSGDPQPSPVRTLVLTGELDHGSASALQRAFDEAYAAEARYLVIDLTGLTFCDSTGISVFLGARRALAAREGGVVLAGLNQRIERIFRLTGVARAFATYPTAEEARAALPGA
ncbi:anti-sigma factor antagonist [Sphaerisporangium krabiense]|uniref:Anti-sigma factor antagonist n=1 Tax=Sphaerisporangium krabiense TaxID=763782 RepID=A0A7W8ZC87_9ACTN|nr:STAS domain-containing protein [Sphaerisporangium krabiense]MBB5631241.1 anti-sigma B factor antagonist [Sphaerisporangium krabiense]GII61146.1 anti-sigma factor antagonist [Sphaerisporangium krabiense]